MRYITVDGKKYSIRGNYTAKQLRELYPKIIADYPGTQLTFKGWLVKYGKVHCSIKVK
jgi:hypothetical protein